MTTIAKIKTVSAKRSIRREQPMGQGIMLRTDESYAVFSSFIEQKICEVKTDRSKAIDALQGTGMYDKHGRLKEEFK